jgi:hypothetical protein
VGGAEASQKGLGDLIPARFVFKSGIYFFSLHYSFLTTELTESTGKINKFSILLLVMLKNEASRHILKDTLSFVKNSVCERPCSKVVLYKFLLQNFYNVKQSFDSSPFQIRDSERGSSILLPLQSKALFT